MKRGAVINVGAREIMQVGLLGLLQSGMDPNDVMKLVKKDVVDIWHGLEQEKTESKSNGGN